MPPMTPLLRRAGALAVVVLVAGCAEAGTGERRSGDQSAGPAQTPTAGPSSPVAPVASPPVGTDGAGSGSGGATTMQPPSGFPTGPTDDLPTNILVGTITKGGAGPCYGMETDDGVPYALYGGDGASLSRGDTVRVTVEPLKLKIYCGEGQHIAIVKLEIVR